MLNNLPGLSDNESLIYRTLLELGPSHIGAILNAVPLKRSNIYATLKTLAAKHLVTEQKGAKITFVPSSPELLIGLAEEEISDSKRQKAALEQSIPDLLSQFRQSSYKPLVKFREGLGGITSLYEELLSDGSQIESIEDGGQMAAFLGSYATRIFPRKRLELGIYNRVIAPSTNTINVSDPESLRETRYVDPEKLPFRMDVKITAHLVSLVTFQKDDAVGILIENGEIRDNFSMLFEYIWSQLENNLKPPR